MTPLKSNPAAVASILAAYAFTSVAELEAAAANLIGSLSQTMQVTDAYNMSPEQALMQGAGPEQVFALVHPHNVAAALLSVVTKRNAMAQPQMAIPAEVLVYTDAGWVPLASCDAGAALLDVTVTLPAPVAPAPIAPAPVAPAPVAPAPAPVAPAAPPAAPAPSAANLSALVDAALAAPVTPAAPAPVVAVAEPVEEAPITAPVAPQTVVATAEVVTPAAPAAPALPISTAAEVVADSTSALPNASVSVGRIGATGRPNMSPFTKEVKPRNKVSDAPFWWGHLIESAPKVFTHGPAEALDTSSDGSGPVQSYAVLVALLRRVLAGVAGEVTVAELRLYLDNVATDIDAQPSAAAINQLVIKLMS